MGNDLNKFVNQMNIIKYLHEGHTRSDVIAKYEISDRTFRNYFNGQSSVRLGNVEFPTVLNHVDGTHDVTIDARLNPIDEIYKTSVHPVFLPLNMTEVYMLTNGILDMLGRNHPYYEAYRHIATKIYSQLSHYAKSCLRDNRHQLSNLDTIAYESEIDMMSKIRNYGVGFYEKRGYPVQIEYIDGTILEGVIQGGLDGPYIVTHDGNNHLIHKGDPIKNIQKK